MESENKMVTNILIYFSKKMRVTDHGICDCCLGKERKILLKLFFVLYHSI